MKIMLTKSNVMYTIFVNIYLLSFRCENLFQKTFHKYKSVMQGRIRIRNTTLQSVGGLRFTILLLAQSTKKTCVQNYGHV